MCYPWHWCTQPPSKSGVRVPPCEYKHDDPLLLPPHADIKQKCIYNRCRQVVEALVLRRRIMIDWLELDLHRTLQCAAGNYFLLERERGGRETDRGRERERETERQRERQRGRGRKSHWEMNLPVQRQDWCKFIVTPSGKLWKYTIEASSRKKRTCCCFMFDIKYPIKYTFLASLWAG